MHGLAHAFPSLRWAGLQDCLTTSPNRDPVQAVHWHAQAPAGLHALQLAGETVSASLCDPQLLRFFWIIGASISSYKDGRLVPIARRALTLHLSTLQARSRGADVGHSRAPAGNFEPGHVALRRHQIAASNLAFDDKAEPFEEDLDRPMKDVSRIVPTSDLFIPALDPAFSRERLRILNRRTESPSPCAMT